MDQLTASQINSCSQFVPGIQTSTIGGNTATLPSQYANGIGHLTLPATSLAVNQIMDRVNKQLTKSCYEDAYMIANSRNSDLHKDMVMQEALQKSMREDGSRMAYDDIQAMQSEQQPQSYMDQVAN